MKIDIGNITAEDWPDDVPRESWQALLSARRQFVHVRIPYDCRQLRRFVEEATPEWLRHFGYCSVDDYIERGLEIDPQIAHWAIEGLKTLGIDSPVALDQAKEVGKLGKKGGQAGNQNARATFDTDTENESDNVRIESDRKSIGKTGGNHRDYTLARLDRDHPELARKVESGELSANAAAIQAGFRRKPTPLDLLRAAWKRASKSERAAFIDEVT